MNKLWAGLGLALSLLAGGCVRARNVKAYPIYSDPADAFDGTAILIGDVEAVDGVSVSKHGSRFEVPVGCHTVTNLTTWGGMDNSAAVMAKLPQIPFAVDMKAGMTYVLRIGVVGPMGNTGRLEIRLREQDKDGKYTREFQEGTRC